MKHLMEGMDSLHGSGCDDNDDNGNRDGDRTVTRKPPSIALGGGVLKERLYFTRLLCLQTQEEPPPLILV